VRCATREGTRLRVGPRKRTVGYDEEAGGTRLRVAERGQGPDDFVAAVENLCIVRAIVHLYKIKIFQTHWI